MAKLFTPIQSVAAAGLLKNKGFGVSANLVAAVNGFNSSSFVAAINSARAANSAPEVLSALDALPGFISGKLNTTQEELIPENINFNASNLIEDIRTQANLVMSVGSTGLINILPQVKNYCQTTYDLLGTFTQVQNTNFDSFGMTIKNYQDILTGGVSSQYRNVAGGVSTQVELTNGDFVISGFAALANQIGNFGTMYDIKNLTKLADPRTLCQNLLNQGFYLVVKALDGAGVNVSNLANEDTRLVVRALESVTGADLDNIVTITKFKPYKKLSTLAEALDISKVLSPAAATAAGGSFNDLSRKLTNIGGNFASFADVKLMYSSIQTMDLPNLSAMNSMADFHLFVGASDTLGSGSGFFGNPIVSDVIGSAGGIGYTDAIAEIVSVHAQLLDTAIGKNLKDAINRAVATPNNSTVAQEIETATNNLLYSTQTATIAAIGVSKFNDLFTRLLNERKNVKAASISLTQSTVTVPAVVAFVSELHNMHQDRANVKYADMVKSITSNDVYGEAIYASIVEGHNIAQLNSRGIQSYTGLDPDEYARFVLSQNPCIQG